MRGWLDGIGIITRPVRWVKVNGKRGYVPIHPRDAEGKEPENLKHGIFVPAERKGGGVERVAYDPGARLKLLAEAPKEFREPVAAPAARDERAQGGGASTAGRACGEQERAPSMIAFDSKARGFTVTTQMHEGGASRTVVSHFSGGSVAGSMARGGSGGGFGGGGARGRVGGGGARRVQRAADLGRRRIARVRWWRLDVFRRWLCLVRREAAAGTG